MNLIEKYITQQPYYAGEEIIDMDKISDSDIDMEYSVQERIIFYLYDKVRHCDKFLVYYKYNNSGMLGMDLPDMVHINKFTLTKENRGSCGPLLDSFDFKVNLKVETIEQLPITGEIKNKIK